MLRCSLINAHATNLKSTTLILFICFDFVRITHLKFLQLILSDQDLLTWSMM